MTLNRPTGGSLTTRQKVTAVIFVLVALFLIWQLIGMFRGGKSTPTPPTVAPAQSAIQTPQPAHLIQPAPPMTTREAQLLKLQQETQAKYINALNELQMLKVSREIAETNQAIEAARLQTVTAQKQIVDLLAPSAPTPPSQVVAPATPTRIPTAVVEPIREEASYRVVSVSQIHSRWSAVIAYQNNLYNVVIGDILTPDQSKIVAIDKNGVLIERKNGTRRRLSLVPLI